MAAPPRTAQQVGKTEKKAKEATTDVSQISQGRLMIRRFRQSKLSVWGGIILVIMYVIALFAPFLAPYHHDAIDTNVQWVGPSKFTFAGGRPAVCSRTQTLDEATFTWIYTADCSTTYPIRFFVQGSPYTLLRIPFRTHLFGVDEPAKVFLVGTDSVGRDLFSRILIGSRISLTIGLIGVGISVLIGAIAGTASGYFGGVIDNVMQRLIEMISSIPTLPLWMALAAAVPRDISITTRYLAMTIVLALVGWTGLARQVRGKVMGYREADYTRAARAAGGSHSRIIMTHMLPNAMSHIIVFTTLAIPTMIGAETALSFLGLGMVPPAVSWGVLLVDAQQIQNVISFPWLMLPAIPVILVMTCYQLLGDGVRDAVDPYG